MDKTLSESNQNLFLIQSYFLFDINSNCFQKEIQVILKSLFRHIFPIKKTS